MELHRLARYEIDREIGQGSFATVYLARDKGTNELVAIKAVKTARLSKKLAENLSSEIAILKDIQHPNIIRLYDIQRSDNYIYLVMEYCEQGDLARYLRRNGIPDETMTRTLLAQLRDAVKVLWSNNLIHRDLKPQNLLLKRFETAECLQLKVADFGFARYVESTDLAETLCGSPLYMAPEVLRYEKYDAKADLWSIGAIAYEMATGSPPFKAGNHIHLLRVIEAAGNKDIWTANSRILQGRAAPRISAELRDLTSRLLKKSPLERMDFTDFFRHSFFGSPAAMSPPNLHRSHSRTLSLQSSRNKGSSNARSRTSSASSSSSVDRAVDEAFKNRLTPSALDFPEALIADNGSSKLLSLIRTSLALVQILDRLAASESNGTASGSSSSFTLQATTSKTLRYEKKRLHFKTALLLVYYAVDILQHCLSHVKVAISSSLDRAEEYLSVGKWLSATLDREFELLDDLKLQQRGAFGFLAMRSSMSMSTISSSLPLNASRLQADAAEEQLDVRIEDILLQAACKIAKEAGIQEVLENYTESESMYLTAIFLLETLQRSADFVPVTCQFAQILASPANSDAARLKLSTLQNQIEHHFQQLPTRASAQ